MDIIVWRIDTIGAKAAYKTMASAVTAEGVLALAALTLSKEPVFVVEVHTTPSLFITELIEGVSALLLVEGLLEVIEPENKTLQ